ncbi:MAG: hypothetical protein QXF15_02925, partial [Candidatus Aenigmatarchaeota archaeon]
RGVWNFLTKEHDITNVPLLGGLLSWVGKNDIGNGILKYAFGINVDKKTGRVTTTIGDTILNATIVLPIIGGAIRGLGIIGRTGATAIRASRAIRFMKGGLEGSKLVIRNTGIKSLFRIDVAPLFRVSKNEKGIYKLISEIPIPHIHTPLDKIFVPIGDAIKSFGRKLITGKNINIAKDTLAVKAIKFLNKFGGNNLRTAVGKTLNVVGSYVKHGINVVNSALLGATNTAIRYVTNNSNILKAYKSVANSCFSIVKNAVSSVYRGISNFFRRK